MRPGLLILGLTLLACGGPSYTGKWESTFGGVKLDLKSDHTVGISVIGIPSEGTWEPKGKNSIVVHGPTQDMTLTRNKDGDLTDGMGGRFIRAK